MRLLDRQVRLLDYLTSAIFGEEGDATLDPALQGMDTRLLRLEARFSHEKRMQKIEWVLTRTLELLGNKRAVLTQEFIDACPPTGISWLENARQFHGFLKTRWHSQEPEPAYLPDVAAYELAYATVRAGETQGPTRSDDMALPGAIRRYPGAVLLRCAYDIRPILEGNDGTPEHRMIRLAVTMQPGTDVPQISELSCDLFELLDMLDSFVDPGIFRNAPELERLLQDLAASGLIEVHA